MNLRTFRARVALWAVAVVSGALTLFGAGVAWNLQRELLDQVDREIQNDARDFVDELAEQPPNRTGCPGTEAFFADETPRFQAVEVRDAAGGLLYRSPSFGETELLRRDKNRGGYGITTNGASFRFRVFEHNGITFALGRNLHDVNETLSGLISAYLVTLPLLAIAVGAGGWWIARRAAAPVRAITARAENISASDLDQRIPALESGDEIAQLASVLNAMFERLQGSFAQVTRFTSDASHELKTPLALMRAQLETALGASGQIAPGQRELLSDLIEQCSQLSQIVDGLLFLSRADDRQLTIERAPVDLVALVQELREDAEILAAEARLTLQFDLPANLIVDGDVRLLRRAVMNLIDNAIKYNRPDGSVVVTASTEGRINLLALRNTGPGIPHDAHAKIFERFYRSDPAHSTEIHGHGLGLSITREIARAHRGEVSLARSASDCTEFWLLLPLAAGSPASPPEHSARLDHLLGP